MSYLPATLGEWQGWPSAKAAWEGYTGTTYTGTATEEQLKLLVPIIVRVGNQDTSAYFEAIASGDGPTAAIGMAYLQRFAQASPTAFYQMAKSGQVSPTLYQQVTGHAITADPLYQQDRINLGLQAMYIPGVGSFGRIEGDGTVRFPDGTAFGNVFDPLFDFDALTAYVKSHLPAAQAATVATVPLQPEPGAAPAPTGPPAGWRRATFGGKSGYMGPDGLFYAGDAPWEGGTTGVSVATGPTPPPPSATAGGAASSTPPAAATTSAPAAQPASQPMPAAGPQPTPLPWEAGPPEIVDYGPEGAPMIGTAGVTGMTGKVVAIAAVAAAAWFLFGRKR